MVIAYNAPHIPRERTMRVAGPCSAVILIALTNLGAQQAPATAKGPTVTHAETRASLDGKPIEMFTLSNGRGLELTALTYGGIIMSLKVPDRAGQAADVVLGF